MKYSLTPSVGAILLLTACKATYPELLVLDQEMLDQRSALGSAPAEAVSSATGIIEYEGVMRRFFSAPPNLDENGEEVPLVIENGGVVHPPAGSIWSVGEMSVSVGFVVNSSPEISGAADNFYEIDLSACGPCHDISNTTGTEIDGSVIISEGYVSGSLTHTNGQLTQYDIQMQSPRFYGDELGALYLRGNGQAQDSEGPGRFASVVGEAVTK